MIQGWHRRLANTTCGGLLVGTLAACGTPAPSGGAPPLRSATVITSGTPATPAASATARADRATLQATLLAQIDEYDRELAAANAAANAAGRCGSPTAATPTGPGKDQVVRLMRERHAEFAAGLT